MALTSQQRQRLLNEARASGMDDDDLATMEWVLADRDAQLDGATRLDLALMLADEAELIAADAFLVEFGEQRKAAVQRGIEAINAMSESEWERLINGDV